MTTPSSSNATKTTGRRNFRARGGVLVVSVVTVALVCSLLFVPKSASAQVEPQNQTQFVTLINALRTSRGLAPMTVDQTLVDGAHSWTLQMVADGSISHAPDLSVGVTANWAKLGENVGVGGDVQRLHDAFVASPGHLANLVDPAFTHIGVSVIRDGNKIFTTHRFMALRDSQPRVTPTTTPPTTAPPTTAPPTTAPPTTLAPTTTAPPATAAPTTTAAAPAPAVTEAAPTSAAETPATTAAANNPVAANDAEANEPGPSDELLAARMEALVNTLDALS